MKCWRGKKETRLHQYNSTGGWEKAKRDYRLKISDILIFGEWAVLVNIERFRLLSSIPAAEGSDSNARERCWDLRFNTNNECYIENLTTCYQRVINSKQKQRQRQGARKMEPGNLLELSLRWTHSDITKWSSEETVIRLKSPKKSDKTQFNTQWRGDQLGWL